MPAATPQPPADATPTGPGATPATPAPQASPATQTAQVAPVTGKARGQRLAWLDALRGFAALLVVFDHLSYYVLQSLRSAVDHVFDPGLYGVFVFFMVSGYIIPASLERKGSVRTFWISRLFRLFPLYIVAIAAVFVLHGLGVAGLRSTDNHPLHSVLAHVFMLSDLLGGVNIINVIWTLSYEMVFYLLLASLFTLRAHKPSGRYALAFALGALLLGGTLPTGWLDRSAFGGTGVALTADLLVIGGLAVAVAARGLPRTLGAALAALTGLTLALVNGWVQPYEGLTILALMFTGTVLYRAEQGQLNRRAAVLFALAVFGCTMAAGAWHIGASAGHGAALAERQWVLSLILAALTFGLGLALRTLPVPSALAWLGLVSYSIYLLHPLLVGIYARMSWTRGYHPFYQQVGLAAGFLAVLLACCAVTYYLVEAPMQRVGRRLAARLDARLGQETAPGTVPRAQAGASA
jgi:peptidoglycan/LPS O-acetylase OafA/YrhL